MLKLSIFYPNESKLKIKNYYLFYYIYVIKNRVWSVVCKNGY